MAVRDIYLKIERIPGYSPVEPDDHVTPPIQYGRDCMRNDGHEDGTIPADEIAARRLTGLVYREYLDSQYLIPKPDKLVAADINEPAFMHRVPGTVIYAKPGERLRIHVKNADNTPHSFHVHGVHYGIDSDGSWPFGTQRSDGGRSDEICPGDRWTYTYQVTEDSIGVWPFHDHCRNIGTYVNRGLFGGLVVMPEHEQLPHFHLPPGLLQQAERVTGEHEDHERATTKPKPKPRGRRGSDDDDHDGDVSGHAMEMGGMRMGGAAMPEMAMTPAGGMTLGHGMDLSDVPAALVPYLVTLDELAHSPQPPPPKGHTLHVPLFFHQMSGSRGTPVFQLPPMTVGQTLASPVFSLPATYNYICGIHGASMAGSITVQAGGPSSATVQIVDFAFNPAHVVVGVGGQVFWHNNGPSQHSVVESGGDSLPSYCFNGRSFVGNTPTIVAHTGQRIRWYVFNLDLSMNWHNFHTHAQRWTFADQQIDVRSIGPAESFMVETKAPRVLLLPEEIEECQHPEHRHKSATEYQLRGDFLVHCHVEMHMMQGLAAIVRSHQSVWLTPAQKHELETTIGLPLDPGGNACPAVQLDRCATAVGGQWEELPGLPQITFMHAVLLANSNRLLYWGYGPRADQARLWDQTTGLYTSPANQPVNVHADENIWSGAHAQLNDAHGTVLAHGGFYNNPAPPLTADTERRAYLFDPTTSNFSAAADKHVGRFYPTTITLADGKPLTLFGSQHAGGELVQASLEIYTPGGAGAWSAPKPIPFNYFYYPWTFLLPGGDLFIAGPQKPARRFNPAATPIIDDPAKQYNQLSSQRGVNMDGTAVLLPLKPPHYAPRVLILGGAPADAQQSAEWIGLSTATPAWQALPDLNVPRDKVNSVLLPDGRVMVAGGIETLPDGGPVEIFDPEDPTTGFQQGPHMKHARGYHSAAILLPDGSVIMGGQGGGADGSSVPNERYRPSYFFKPRPTITGSPAAVGYGAALAIKTPTPAAIAEVVLMRAGAVTHGFNQNQRYVGCLITGTSATEVHATSPPDGNTAPPGHYLLFLVDHDRTPSLGVWLHLS
jgi:FtsP/CotA-like multicopper oxidase with cupredoxin domain